MSSQDLIRLRVSVQRHGVPEVKLVWPCARFHDLTVSKFLSQINKVMPLESGEWGLEDYVVELADGAGGSYECLHFQPVPHILKNDDHILIRCLHGEDLKRCRLSDRHQISADGRHLVDSLVFGRPWLRTPRATAAATTISMTKTTCLRLHRHACSRSARSKTPATTFLQRVQMTQDWLDEEHDEGSDEEFNDASGEVRDEVAEELGYLRKEDWTGGHHIPANNPKNTFADDEAIEARAPTTGGLDLGALDGIVALRAAFPRTPVIAIEAELLGQHKDLRKAYNALSGSHEPALRFDEMIEKAVVGLLFPGQASSSGSPDDHLVHQRSSAPRPLIQVVQGSDKPEDAAAALVHAPSNVVREQGRHDTSLQPARPVSTTEDDTVGDTENMEDTAEDIDASDDTDSSSNSDSSSDESSSDDSESDSDSSNDDAGSSIGRQAAQDTRREGGQGGAEASSGTSGAPSGRTKTQKRNARRRRSLARIQAENRRQQSDEAFTFEVRKQQLLRKVDENVEVTGESQNVQVETVQVEKVQVSQDDNGAEQTKNGHVSSTTPDPRRSRVDLGAGRRLLFGSLGFKSPKTRADEEKIKQGFMKGVRPLNNMRLVEGEKAAEGPSAAAGPDADDWLQKRWDPQQRGRACRKRKRTLQEFLQDYYEDDDSGLYMEEDVGDPFGLDALGEDEAAGKTPSSETEGRNATAQADDVPPLPADVSSLADLRAGEAKEGMVITWKQIAMSKATRWQPTVQPTATVLGGSDDTKLSVLLAMRDREDKSKAYDKMGQRIYDKFEMPDSDSDEEGEDDGERMVSWAEMTEPKIVRMPEEKQG